jgi:hypothetical protein
VKRSRSLGNSVGNVSIVAARTDELLHVHIGDLFERSEFEGAHEPDDLHAHRRRDAAAPAAGATLLIRPASSRVAVLRCSVVICGATRSIGRAL